VEIVTKKTVINSFGPKQIQQMRKKEWNFFKLPR